MTLGGDPRGGRQTTDRGQTPQDFAFGVSILLVTVIAVFALLQGGLLTVYDEPVDGDVKESADRVAAYLVDQYAVSGSENTLRFNRSDGTGLNESLHADAADGELDDLKDAAGLNVSTDRRMDPHLNVTVVNSSAIRDGQLAPAESHSGYRLTWGERFSGDREAVSVRRVISLEDRGNKCDTVCWLVVRVW